MDYTMSKELKNEIEGTKLKDIKDQYHDVLEDYYEVAKERDILKQANRKLHALTSRQEENIKVAINRVKESTELVDKANSMIDELESEKHTTSDNNRTLTIKKYPRDDRRYENIMSHMDILWHSGKYGSDGCGKCTGYRDILMSAFDKIESMSSRNISEDFATTHRNPGRGKTVKDNNNHVRMRHGEVRGGDKSVNEYAPNCFNKD